MTETIYFTSMTVTITLLLFMGAHLILGYIPQSLKKTVYGGSRRVLGIAYTVLAIDISIATLFNFRLLDSALAPANFMAIYMLIAMLLSLSFTRLLGNRRYFTKSRIRWNFVAWFIYSAALISSVAFIENEFVVDTILVVGAVIYIIKMILHVCLFMKSYKLAILKAQNFYTEKEETILEWMPMGIYNIMFFALIGGVISFCNYSIVAIFTIYVLAVFIYIYLNANNMMIKIQSATAAQTEESIIEVIAETPIQNTEKMSKEEIKEEEEKEMENTNPMSADTLKMIETKLAKWVEKKRYLERGVSIQNAAIELYTNRTYLSRYINTKYNCTFRDWVITLRIKEAKRLIIESKGRVHINDISNRVGFSAPSSFTRAFSREEGISPAKWRETQRIQE